jgi:16S rRNA processing protein RimM
MEAAHTGQHSPTPDLTVIGRTGRAVGLKGFSQIFPLGETLVSLTCGDVVYVGKDPRSADRTSVAEKKRTSRGILLRFTGVGDRDSAEKLRNTVIYRETSLLPDLPEDTYYHFELEGMSVFVDTYDNRLGTVRSVHNYPTVDALEIECTDRSLILVPMKPDTVTSIDRDRRTVLIDSSRLTELL